MWLKLLISTLMLSLVDFPFLTDSVVITKKKKFFGRSLKSTVAIVTPEWILIALLVFLSRSSCLKL